VNSMNMKTAWMTAGALAAALAILLLAGCATTGGGSATALTARQVDSAALGSQRLDAIRVETFGPNIQQLFGYFLYRDGITVNVTGRITGKNLGKMTLAEVRQDYQRLLRENMIYGGNLVIREVLHGGMVVGYSANMPALNYTVWNMTPDAPAANATLQLTFP
jgi:hypothetical protein